MNAKVPLALPDGCGELVLKYTPAWIGPAGKSLGILNVRVVGRPPITVHLAEVPTHARIVKLPVKLRSTCSVPFAA